MYHMMTSNGGITNIIQSILRNNILGVLVLIIIGVIIVTSINLLLVRLLLCFPPIRHLAQSIFRAISGRD